MAFRSHRIESDLSVLEQKFVAQSQLLASTPSIAPVRGILTDGFGGRSDPFTGEPGTHNAVDISSAVGQAVRAPADGIVVKAEWAQRLRQRDLHLARLRLLDPLRPPLGLRRPARAST